ncbi:MAG: putative histidine kinase [Candidatus Saccharibacteria bacterium]|nr:putative histidine kinase [Candidatus Saccharibacteria bacterium]
MFSKKISKRLLNHDLYVRPLLPAFLVFLALMVIIVISWHTAKQDIITQQKNIVTQNSTFVESSLAQRFTVYENSLRAANGLFLSSDSVTRAEWKEFVLSLDLPDRYPGIRGLGFVKVLPAADKVAFEEANRSDDLNTYTVYPDTNTDIIAPLQFIVPLGTGSITDDHNAPVLGLDMYSVPERFHTMQKAAENNSATLSSIIDLIKSPNNKSNRGFLLFSPLYKKDLPHNTKEERLAALDGFFYAPFVSDGVFKSLFDISDPSFAFTIYDGTPSQTTQLYQSSDHVNDPQFHQVKTTHMSLFGQDWEIVYKVKNEIVPYSVRERPLSVIIGGSIFAAALAAIIYLLIQRRTRTLAYVEQKKLEEAKDDLLSLASHQLRTPATAVKQYVSMVKEGFAGELTPDQHKLLQSAYESNERQLTIVDDLLYVARLDAGKTTLKPENINISDLIISVIDEQRAEFKVRKQKVLYNVPKRPVMCVADPQYLRMIVENLLSNASKYSFEKTAVIVGLQNTKDAVLVNVTDSGVGIKSEDYKDVFMKFSRIPNELTRQTSGSGIGLYLAKQLALLHGGDLTFISKHNKGTTFTLSLPKSKGLS